MVNDCTQQNAVFGFLSTSADASVSSVFQRAVLLMAAAVKSIARSHCERRNVRALASLGERQLKDMGINRSEIESVVRHGGMDRTRARNLHG